MKKQVHDYLFFTNVSPRIKGPFGISLFFHLILISLPLFVGKTPVYHELQVEIIRTPDQMSIKNRAKISALKDIEKGSLKNRKDKIMPGTDSKSLLQVPDETDNQADNGDSGFIRKFENLLFNKKNTDDSNKENRQIQENNDKLKWKEENEKVAHLDKTQARETIKVKGGKGQSRNITWRDGYARRLLSQPEFEYPLYFRQRGIQGTVVLSIEVDAYGNVVGSEIVKTSGYSKLDILARTGMLKAKFTPKETMAGGNDHGQLEVQYRLDQ